MLLASYKFELQGIADRHATLNVAAQILPSGRTNVEQLKAAAIEALGPIPQFRIGDLRYSEAQTGEDPALYLTYWDLKASSTDAPSLAYAERVGHYVHFVA
jgi:hypothetical protein